MSGEEYRELEKQVAAAMGWTDFETVPVPPYATISGREPYELATPPVGGKQDVPRYVTDPLWTGEVKRWLFAQGWCYELRNGTPLYPGEVFLWVLDGQRRERLGTSSEAFSAHNGDCVTVEAVALCRAVIAAVEATQREPPA
jgi:hypothetical protein